MEEGRALNSPPPPPPPHPTPTDRTGIETFLTDTLVSGQLYLRTPSRNPVFLNSHTNAANLHSRKRSAPVTSTLFSSRGCLLTRTSTVPRRCLGNYVQTCLFCDPSMTNFSTIFASCLYRSTIGVRLSL